MVHGALGGNPLLAALLQKQQSPFTPGINPNAPNPQQAASSPLSDFLGKPGGSFLMNLLAQQGFSKTPSSPFAAIGRAGLATQAQSQAQEQSELQKRLIESQIGLNTAKSQPSLTGPEPLTAEAKIQADVRSGLLTPEQGQKLLNASLREGSSKTQADVKSLRGEFRTDVAGPRASLSGLAAAEQLLANNNAISDTAAFTSFIRAIDNSVVRPAEQDAYNKALGIRNQIEATVQQWAGKGPLPPQTKRALLESVRSLREIMEGISDRTVQFYAKEAEKFDLDPESVTGIPIKFDEVDVQIDDDDGGTTEEDLRAELEEIEAERRRLRGGE